MNPQNEDKRRAPQKEYQTKEEDGKTLYLDEPSGEWVSKNEIKTREKLREKEAKKSQKPVSGTKGEKADKKVEEEKVDPTQYTDNRKNWI